MLKNLNFLYLIETGLNGMTWIALIHVVDPTKSGLRHSILLLLLYKLTSSSFINYYSCLQFLNIHFDVRRKRPSIQAVSKKVKNLNRNNFL